jgi:hypothetical protein
VFASLFQARAPLEAVRLAMVGAAGLYLASLIVVAFARSERPAQARSELVVPAD